MNIRPLDGTRVVDLTHALAGPMCTYQLALLGADVIKIENPAGGDDFRAYAKTAFDAVNGGKRSVVLDLKDIASLAVIERLVRRADVLVDNFKPGAAEKFGLDWDLVRGWNDQVIWCSISGFGLDGPWRDKPAVEWSAQAASGLSDAYLGPDQDPHDLGLGVLDVSTGTTAASAILAALLLRQKTQRGQRIDVAMIDVALTLLAPRVPNSQASGFPRRASIGRFAAADGPVFVMGAHQRWFEAISRVLGEPGLIADPRFATMEARTLNREALRVALEERLSKRAAEDWANDLNDAGVPAAPVRNLKDVVASEHVRKRGSIVGAAVSGSEEAISVMGLPFRFADDTPVDLRVPQLGEHTEEVLAELALDERAQ